MIILYRLFQTVLQYFLQALTPAPTFALKLLVLILGSTENTTRVGSSSSVAIRGL